MAHRLLLGHGKSSSLVSTRSAAARSCASLGVLVMKRPNWSPSVPRCGRLGPKRNSCTPTQIGSLLRISSSSSSKRDNHDEYQGQQQEQPYQVWGFPATDRNKSFQDRKKNGTLLYAPTIPTLENSPKEDSVKDLNDGNTGSDRPAQLQEKVLTHFLPADYPHSVAPGYIQYATYGFIASVAGSAGMILSTQTLLLAVGVVGSSPESQAVAPIMAGALNWVLKDGIGQFGGVLFASVLGQTRNLDVYPKQWRMVAAISLDCATFLELLSPMVPSWFVLPIASMATVGKNIGFLTASASRAALHQALAIRGNSLADVTVKAGSQSIAAGLMGTSFGIVLSSVLFHVVSDAQEVPHYFLMGFGALAMIHQGCTYQSLQLVPLAHLNRHRLELVLRHYLGTGHVMSPAEVAPLDLHIPWLSSTSTSSSAWLSIGSPLEVVCPDSSEREQLLTTAIARRTNSNNNGSQEDQGYILYTKQDPLATKKENGGSGTLYPLVHLVFWEDATGADEIRGMMHAFLLRQMQQQRDGQHNLPDTNSKSLVEDNVENRSNTVTSTHHCLVQEQFPKFLEQLQVQGWKTGSEFTTIESRRSQRLGMVRL